MKFKMIAMVVCASAMSCLLAQRGYRVRLDCYSKLPQ